MDVYCFCCVRFLCLCTGRGFVTSWSPVQGVLPTVLDLVTEVKWKISWRRPRTELDCRAKGGKISALIGYLITGILSLRDVNLVSRRIPPCTRSGFADISHQCNLCPLWPVSIRESFCPSVRQSVCYCLCVCPLVVLSVFQSLHLTITTPLYYCAHKTRENKKCTHNIIVLGRLLCGWP
jgi:hypothetical protein